ncbi:MAG TPA: L,D-transpeptidase family protein [Allosphingosinicella sp.]|jgi:lipoprotein-anchoring transpeptidase ErfK/SrfK
MKNPLGIRLKWIPLQGMFFVVGIAATLLSVPGTDPADSHPRPAPRVEAAAPAPAAPRLSEAGVVTSRMVAEAAQAAPASEPVPGAVAPEVPVHKLLAIPRWLHDGEFVWDDNAPTQGPLEVVVDLRLRLISVYRGGIEIGRSAIIYGADDKPTPKGTFPILEKDIDHVSNIYDAPMPYMMRLTMDGVALHGSAEITDYVATNGCVGLPDDFAAKLFAQAKIGDRVTIVESQTA